VVRYRSRADVECGCKEGATVAAHIGGLRGAGTWLSPADVEGGLPNALPYVRRIEISILFPFLTLYQAF
jgi:hypothetical protein